MTGCVLQVRVCRQQITHLWHCQAGSAGADKVTGCVLQVRVCGQQITHLWHCQAGSTGADKVTGCVLQVRVYRQQITHLWHCQAGSAGADKVTGCVLQVRVCRQQITHLWHCQAGSAGADKVTGCAAWMCRRTCEDKSVVREACCSPRQFVPAWIIAASRARLLSVHVPYQSMQEAQVLPELFIRNLQFCQHSLRLTDAIQTNGCSIPCPWPKMLNGKRCWTLWMPKSQSSTRHF